MQLTVPYQEQQTDGDCVIAGIAMFLGYYAIPYDYNELLRKYPQQTIGNGGGGTYMPQVALELLERGFAVDFITCNPYLLTKNQTTLTQADIRAHFAALLDLPQLSAHKHVINYFLQFMDAGGTITIKVPTLADVVDELRHERPVGYAGTTQFFLSKKPSFNSHFVLITGEDEHTVKIQDPHKTGSNVTGTYTITHEEFLYSMYASAHIDIDNALIMRVKPHAHLH